MTLEDVFLRLGAQRNRMRAALGGRRSELVQFALLLVLILPWWCLLVLPSSTPRFGLLAGPVFLLGWFGLAVLQGAAPRTHDRSAAALTAVCALVSLATFAVAVWQRPRPAPPEVWTPPAEGVLEAEVARPR
jgi:hypothetical protein